MAQINRTIHNLYKIVIHQNFHAWNENAESNKSEEVQIKKGLNSHYPIRCSSYPFFITPMIVLTPEHK